MFEVEEDSEVGRRERGERRKGASAVDNLDEALCSEGNGASIVGVGVFGRRG